MERAKTVAREFFEELVDISVIRGCSRKDMRDMGITDGDQIGHILNGGKIPKSETKTSDIRNFCFLACI